MKLIELLKKNPLCLISIFIFAVSLKAQEDDVELRIDFTSGSVIANEKPKLINPINNITVPVGTTDTIIADLNEVFNDAESGSELSFSAKVLDDSFVKVDIKGSDSTVHLKFWPGMKGRTRIVFSASDGSKEVSDTINVIVKDQFLLSDTLTDTIVKSSYSVISFNKDISKIFPKANLNEKYEFKVSSSDSALVEVTANNLSRSITMVIADSSYGSAEINIAIIDNDELTVHETFNIVVKKRFSRPEYSREIVGANPGISVYTGIEYSGALLKLWVKDVFGIAMGGYYHWNQKGVGFDGALMAKLPLSFVLQPYIMASVGYHNQTITKTVDNMDYTSEMDLDFIVIRGGAGIEAWLGKSKQHVLGVEAGYTYGESEYSSMSVSKIGSSSIEKSDRLFKKAPLHLRVGYTLFFRKL